MSQIKNPSAQSSNFDEIESTVDNAIDQIGTYDVFISYGRKDQERVRGIANALEAAGLSVWWDPDIPPGVDFRTLTTRALSKAKAVIVVWSEYSVGRHFVLDEAGVALDRENIFPVLIDTVDIPLGFRQIQTVDLTSWHGKPNHPALLSLVSAIKEFVSISSPQVNQGKKTNKVQSQLSKSRFTTTGAKARLKLFFRSMLLAFTLSAVTATLFSLFALTNEGLEIVDTEGEVDWEDYWIALSIISTITFFGVLIARSVTFWADAIRGATSIKLTSRPFMMLIGCALLVTAPIDPFFRISDIQKSLDQASFSPDGSRIVTASSDDTAKIWDANNGKLLQTLRGHGSYVVSASFSPDGSLIITGSWDDTAKIWDASNGRLIRTLRGHKSNVNFANFSPDGSRIVTASWDDTAKIWDASNGRLIRTLKGHENSVTTANFSPDGSRIVTASWDDTAKIWDAASGRVIRTLKGHERNVYSANFSPDGSRIVTASSDDTAKIWDAASGRLIQTLKGHESSVNSANFSPDGSRIVTGSGDKTAKIWDNSGRFIRTLRGHNAHVEFAQFSPDGLRVVTAADWDDGRALLWDARTGEPLIAYYNSPKPFIQFSTTTFPILMPITKPIDLKLIYEWENWILPIVRGLTLLALLFTLSAIIRLIARIFISREKAHKIRGTILTVILLYISSVYLTNLAPLSILFWVLFAIPAVLVFSIIRLFLIMEIKTIDQ